MFKRLIKKICNRIEDACVFVFLILSEFEEPQVDDSNAPKQKNKTALPTSNSAPLLADLIEQWEKRAKTADKLAHDAADAGDCITSQRCKIKAGVIRSMTLELKREISQLNERKDHA